MTMDSLRVTSVLAACVPLACPIGCTYERVVSREGLSSTLQRLSEAKQEGGGARVEHATASNQVFHVPEGKLRVEDEESGEVTLYAKRVKHLINHIITTLENDEPELFVEQVLSKITREEFEQRGLDPVLAFEELTRRRRDVYKLFGAMPMGEGTPGLFLEQIGTNMFRLKVPRGRHPDLYWTGIDASFEGNNYRLRWFVR